MKYLANKYKLPDHWYPSDAKRRAKVDEYLFWHASNLRAGAAQQFFSKVLQELYVHVSECILFCLIIRV